MGFSYFNGIYNNTGISTPKTLEESGRPRLNALGVTLWLGATAEFSASVFLFFLFFDFRIAPVLLERLLAPQKICYGGALCSSVVNLK